MPMELQHPSPRPQGDVFRLYEEETISPEFNEPACATFRPFEVEAFDVGSSESNGAYGRVNDDDQKLVSRPYERSPFLLKNLWWLLEPVAALLSLLTLVILVVVLQYFDRQLQKPWRYGITPNAVIAGLTTIIRTSLGVCVTAALSQSGWNWYARLNGEKIGRGKKIEDFGLFDEASRGSWGSAKLLWRFQAVRYESIL